MKMRKSAIFKIFNLLFLAVFITAAIFLVGQQIKKTNDNLSELNKQLTISNQKIAALQNRLEEVAQDKSVVKEEVVRREVIREKSQEELLTAAVAKVAPSVVSIVVSKDMPRLEVSYENPFGNDPFFKDFGFKIPVYRQKGTERQNVGAGTGFLIRSDGYILTNKHVAEDTASIYTALLSDGSQKAAQVVYRDAAHDIAILKIEGAKYAATELGDSDALKLGQSVFAVGNALGQYSNSVSVGIISGLNRAIEANSQNGVVRLENILQTDAAVNPGNSGGPLVDLNGRIVGVNVATVIGSNNISFSIPINSVKKIISSAIK